MPTVKIAVTIEKDLVSRLDLLVKQNRFPSRSRAVQEAIQDKLKQLRQSRFSRECAKLDPAEEQAMAEEGLAQDLEQWPEY